MTEQEIINEIEDGIKDLFTDAGTPEKLKVLRSCVKYTINLKNNNPESPKQIYYWFDQDCLDNKLKESIAQVIRLVAENHGIRITSTPL